MFRYQLNAFRQAEARCHKEHDRDGHYIVANERRVTVSTKDEQQADHWLRFTIVHYALIMLGRTPSASAGFAASTAYAAFARELETNP